MGTFQCGVCNLIEDRISKNTILELSAYHFAGKHIDKYQLRKIKSDKKNKSKKLK